MGSSNWIAIAAVTSSMLVAISTIIAPAVASACQWKRERKAARAEQVSDLTVAVLTTLARFHTFADDGNRGKLSEAHAQLHNEFYAWQVGLWFAWSRKERERADKLRESIEETHKDTLHKSAAGMIQELLELTRAAQ